MVDDDDYNEEDEDESITLQDIKDLVETAKSVVEFGIAFKKLTEPAKPPSRSDAHLRTLSQKEEGHNLGTIKKGIKQIGKNQETSKKNNKIYWGIGITIAIIGILIAIFI